MSTRMGRALAAGCLLLALGGCGSATEANGPHAAGTSVVPLSAPSGCPPPMKATEASHSAIDYLDTFRLNSHDYLAHGYLATERSSPTPWDPSHIGALAGHIKCTLSAYPVDPGYHLRDGDATLLPVGTAVFLASAKVGTTDLVAEVAGRWLLYSQIASS